MNELNDVSEIQVSDWVYSNNGLEVVVEIDADHFYTSIYAYERHTGQCVALPQTYARHASRDDHARHAKKVLVDKLNSTEFSRMSIEKLERIMKAVKS